MDGVSFSTAFKTQFSKSDFCLKISLEKEEEEEEEDIFYSFGEYQNLYTYRG